MPRSRDQQITPLAAIAQGLVLVGRPFYFLISRIIFGLIISIYLVGHSISYLFTKIGKLKPKTRVRKKKRAKKAILKLPEITIGNFIRLEGLRIILFELKLSVGTKNFFKKLKKGKIINVVKILPLFIIIALFFFFYFLIIKGLPSPKELTRREPEVSTKIYDRNGNLLFKIYKDQNRTIVPLDKIPSRVRFATLAAEDAEFYSHPGFSVRGIFRALVSDLENNSLQGGSTITQQLVKNTLLSPEQTLTRKIKELVLSVEVEATYSKDQIFEMYLNEVNYGGTAYGIEEASQEIFGKNVWNLDLAEAALLAGLPKSPTAYSPFGQNPNLAIERQHEVLQLMVINKFITADQEKAALSERLTFAPQIKDIKAPHFVMYVRQILVDKYGEDMVAKGGLEVTTSLDLPTQIMAEKVVSSEVEKLKGLNVGNGAAIVINPQTGEILAMVGSKNYFDTNYDGQVNVTTSLRQPGSSIKVVNYAYALAHGYTPSTIIDDSPITYSIPGSEPYSPVNYDGVFKGKISLRNALAQSRNIPAVKVLASYGVDKMITQGKLMGITTWDEPSKYGLSLTLGGGAVKMIDLIRVYSALANYGRIPEILPILEVKDYKDKVLEKNEPKTFQVIDPRVAFLLTDILKDNNARAPEFGLNSYLVIKNHPEVAVKTGTSNDLRDNWTVGYNQNFLVATWVGNNDNSPMSHIASGITGASPIWNYIISAVLEGGVSIDWKVPNGLSKVNICSITNTLPCNSCPTTQEWFFDEAKPVKSCIPEQIQKILSPSPIPQGPDILQSGASTRH